MSRDYLTIEELTAQLGRERRVVDRMVQRGHVPGRRIGGEWRFNKTEITQWLEQEIRDFDESELASFERQYRPADKSGGGPIQRCLSPDTIEVPLDAGTRPSVIRRLVSVAANSWHVFDQHAVIEAVQAREDVASTGFDNGVAFPHPKNRMPEAIGDDIIAFGRTTGGIPFGAPNRQLTDLFFLVLARDADTHLEILARLGRLCRQPEFTSGLRACEDSAATLSFIRDADDALGD